MEYGLVVIQYGGKLIAETKSCRMIYYHIPDSVQLALATDKKYN